MDSLWTRKNGIIAAGVAVAASSIFLFRKWAAGGQVPREYLKSNSLADKIVVITGGNTGIGFETAKTLSSLGATVYIACRSETRAKEAIKKIQNKNKSAKLEVLELDLGDLDSVKRCAEEFRKREAKLDMLINNAGIMACPHGLTKQGFEIQWGTNHLGHFLLTLLLLDKVSKDGRIINVSSRAHTRGLQKVCFDELKSDCKGNRSPFSLYSQSKLSNVYFTYELEKKLDEYNKANNTNITTCCLHPGVVATELMRSIPMGQTLIQLVAKTPYEGAQTTIYCAVAPDSRTVKGKYMVDCKAVPSSPASYDKEAAQKLWTTSTEFVKSYLPEKLKI